MSRARRRFIALGLVSLQVSACATWQHPKTSLTPAEYVAAEQPDRVLVTTTSGRKVTLVRPEVAGDSLVAGVFTRTVPRTRRVALARVSPSAITVLKADEAGYRQIRIATDHGVILVDDPVFSTDSVIGTQPLAPYGHRTGVRLADIRSIEVQAVNGELTALYAVGLAAAIGMGVVAVAFAASMN